jgi:DsbC/DsbD-like thiol-disulfide interchange protein
LGIAAISYDSVPILKSFADRMHITFPLLSDTESKIIRSYDILNETAQGMTSGIPYPGTYILDAKGVVVEKYFEDSYTERYTASDILAKEFGAAVGAAHSTIAAKHLKLSASAGVDVAHIGQRIVLALDIDLPKGMHVYAPGVQGYIPIDFAIAESTALAAHPAVYPPSKSLHLKVIKETVPVYTDHVRVLREITMSKNAKPGELTVDGSFRYQACDDKECFIPETVPLKWVLRVEPLDRQRAPTEIQHK